MLLHHCNVVNLHVLANVSGNIQQSRSVINIGIGNFKATQFNPVFVSCTKYISNMAMCYYIDVNDVTSPHVYLVEFQHNIKQIRVYAFSKSRD